MAADLNKTTLTLRCLAVDDEPFALKLLADDISKIPFLQLVNTCASPLEALEYLRKETIHLLFLDIQMPILKGTDFLRTLENPPLVIFTTAYQQYALEGFELNVVDYLMKPIPFDRFLKAANKAYDQFSLRHTAANSVKTEKGFLFVYSEYKEIKIFHDDILYIEGLKDYVKIFLSSQQRPVMTRLNLKGMDSKLPADLFSRVHNSYIVSLSKIDFIQKSQISVRGNIIPLGEKFANEFRRKFKSTQ
jgi:DNA-binding LytR/AlgR family response regulator